MSTNSHSTSFQEVNPPLLTKTSLLTVLYFAAIVTSSFQASLTKTVFLIVAYTAGTSIDLVVSGCVTTLLVYDFSKPGTALDSVLASEANLVNGTVTYSAATGL